MGVLQDKLDIAQETVDGLYRVMGDFDLTNIQRREFKNVIDTIENLKFEYDKTLYEK